jgi:hypothetical protein
VIGRHLPKGERGIPKLPDERSECCPGRGCKSP